jgi:hypothetical protein
MQPVDARDPRPGDTDPARRKQEALARITVTPFMRLARTHALLVAGDAAAAVALAGSLFFDAEVTEARGKVALYLLLTLAPFSLVAPLIGPAIDRMAGGRRLMVVGSAVGRSLLALLLVANLDGFVLYPLAFGLLVLGKAYAVSKSALVPTVVTDDAQLVEANSRLGVIGGIVGVVAAVPALLLKLAGASFPMAMAALAFGAGAIAAWRLPHRAVASEPEAASERAELRAFGIVLSASAMAFLRATVGFLVFHIAFWFRGDDIGLWWLGVVAAGSAVGTLAGNAIGPSLRRAMREERILVACLGVTALAGAVTGVVGGALPAAVLAVTVGAGAAAGRLAFDAIVQRDAPDANQGRAFARFETRFQLAWVTAAFVPVIVPIPGDLGLVFVGLLAAAALGSYLVGANHLRRTGELPTPLRDRAVREIRARRRRGGAIGGRIGGPPEAPEAPPAPPVP